VNRTPEYVTIYTHTYCILYVNQDSRVQVVTGTMATSVLQLQQHYINKFVKIGFRSVMSTRVENYIFNLFHIKGQNTQTAVD
jgi:hypothetical protein